MQTMLYMLSSQNGKQMMSYILKTREGKLIVIDGGNREEADNLMENLIKLGGEEPVVDLWILTHPHDDHVWAMLELFSRPNPPKVKRMYSHFLPYEFYKSYDIDGAYSKKKDRAETTRCYECFKKEHEGLCFSLEEGQELVVGSASIKVLHVPKEDIQVNVINNSSVVFRVDTEGQRILFIGDLGEEAGDEVLGSVVKEELVADFVQMAHHGQNGVKKSFYEVVAPKACMWNTPQWLWDNDKGKGYDTGPWRTVEVRKWMEEINVRHHFVMKDGRQEIPLPYPL